MGSRSLAIAGVAVSTFASQAVWVTFAPVSTLVAEDLGVTPEEVGLLALLYPIFFLLLTVPSGALLDRSPRTWVAAGSILTGMAGALRLLDPTSYVWLLACQVLGALGQPFLLNSFALLASRMYPERREAVVALLSFSMYLGIIYALGTGYAIYTNLGLVALMTPIALASAAGAVMVVASLGSLPSGGGGSQVLSGLRYAAGQKDLWLLGLLLGLGVALFDNMSIWLEAALAPTGLGDVAGLSVALSLLAGLLGVAIIPGLVARLGARTLYIRIVVLTVTLIYVTLSLETARLTVLTLIPLAGLLMLPAYPIIMEWVSRFHDPRVQGSAAGFIGLVSRALTVTLASAAVAFIHSPSTYFLYLAGLSLAGLAISLALPKR